MSSADPVWDAFVDLLLAEGANEERPSRYGDKPAVRLGTREIAHLEGPGEIDVRITRDGWRAIAADYADDPAVTREPGRRDWLELRLSSPAGVAAYRPLVQTLIRSNR